MKNIFKIVIGFILTVPLFVTAVSPFFYTTRQGGTGTSTPPTYGKLLMGTDAGVYMLVSTSSLGITATGDGTFSTTSVNYWKTVTDLFSTTSAAYWDSTQTRWATTSTDYWKTINNFFSTTSADFWITASTTIPKTTLNNIWTGMNTFLSSTTLQDFTAGTATTTTLTTGQVCFTSGLCMNTPSVEGSAITLYPWNTATDIATYEGLRTLPDSGAEVDESCAASSGYCAAVIDNYVSTTSLATAGSLVINNIPAGTWNFDVYTYVNVGSGASVLEFTVFKRSSAGTETQLFQATTSAITNTAVDLKTFNSAQQAFTFASSDRLLVRVRGYNPNATSRTIHWVYENGAHYSHITTPITIASEAIAFLPSDNTFTGANTFSASTTFQAQTNMQQASTSMLTVSNSLWVTPLTSALILTGADGLMAEYAGASCTNQFVRSLSALGASTCASVANTDLSNSTIGLTTSGSLTIGTSPISLGGTSALNLNMANANTWTALQTFGNASTTNIGSTGSAYFATAGGNVGIGTVAPSGKLEIRTDGQSGVPALGTAGNGLNISRTADGVVGMDLGYDTGGNGYIQVQRHDSAVAGSLMLNPVGGNVGIGTTTPSRQLHLYNSDSNTTSFGNTTNGLVITNPLGDVFGHESELIFAGSGATNPTLAGVAGGYDVYTNQAGGTLKFGTRSADSANGTGILERMRITSEGNVGIGTVAPGSGSKLTIADTNKALASRGNLYVYSTDSMAQDLGGEIVLGGSYTGTYETIFGAIAARKENGTNLNTDSYLTFGTNANATGLTEKMRINSSGNVGIGTVGPYATLEVNGAIYSSVSSNSVGFDSWAHNNAYYNFMGGGSLWGIRSDTSAGFNIDVYNSNSIKTALTIKQNANVGIGTTSPSATLHVVSAATSPSLTHGAAAQSIWGYSGGGTELALTLNNSGSYEGALQMRHSVSDGFSYPISLNPLGGNVGIGTVTPLGKLQVAGDVSTDPTTNFYGQIEAIGGTSAAKRLSLGYNTTGNYGVIQALTNAATYDNLVLEPGGGNVGIASTTPYKTFSVNGTGAWVGLTTNTGAATASLCLGADNEITKNTDAETCIASSIRYKKNVEVLSDKKGLAEILKLTPVSFNYKDPAVPEKKLGFIAETVEKIDTRLVSYDEEGKANGIRWSHITTLIVGSIQELVAKITGLEDRLTKDEQDIKELKAQVKLLINRK